MEELKNELNRILQVASDINGVHGKVAREMGWTIQYQYGINSGDRLTKDKPKNRETIKNIIDAYKHEIEKHRRHINEVDTFSAKNIEVIL